MIIRYLFISAGFAGIAFIVHSCARISSPTGGPKDSIPPVLLRSTPKQNEINVKTQRIDLEFSEAITLNNAKEQIIIAPTDAGKYEITSKKKTVTIKFDEPLKDSVTYSLNFRDAVQDITEKNPAKNLSLAFSTGTYIDSLIIKGKVYNQLTEAVPKDVTVAIHELNDTISIFKHKPAYLTKADEQGKFILKNLKAGAYTIYAVEDKNRNLLADSRTELYAFKADTINLPQDTTSVKLGLIKLDARPLKLTSARPYNNYFNIKTSKNLDRFTAKPTQPTDTIISAFGEDRANIRIYNTFNTDSTLIAFSAIDSIGNQLDSNVYVKFQKREVKPDKFSANLDKSTLLREKGTLDMTIKFNKPTFLINTDSLLFATDTVNIIDLTKGTLTWNNMTNELRITMKIEPALLKQQTTAAAGPSTQKTTPSAPPTTQRQQKPGEQPTGTPPGPPNGNPPNGQNSTPDKLRPAPQNSQTSPQPTATKPKAALKNQLIIAKGTFITIDQDTMPRVEKEIKPISSEDLGVILCEVTTSAEHFIVQLLDKDFKTVLENYDTKKIRWEDVTPGDYRIRLVIDQNNNQKWDPGNYLKKEEPEKVFFYLNPKSTPPNTTHLKAGWEIGPLLITSE